MGFNCTFAIALGDVSDDQLARLQLRPTGVSLTLDDTSQGSAGLGVGVARLGDFTVLTDGSVELMFALESPELLTGTWFVTVSSSVTDTYRYEVISDGRVTRSIGLIEGELEESGEPIGDESGFTRLHGEDDNVEGYDGEELLWILPATSGFGAAHPGMDILDLEGTSYVGPEVAQHSEMPPTTSTLNPADEGKSRPWWQFWG